ncbi:unnamed protein product [Rhizoctonia solani]|uniref:Uncharacterized protein n=1 Tax=Rhizoctonia solani TaxID=456999 RepID=A0A8H3AG16_9AGAM|nr:unnamed protein product [Rhizoctonia solani]
MVNNATVVQLPNNIPPFPEMPDPDETHLVVVGFSRFMLLVGKHAALTFGYLLPSEGPITATDSDSDSDSDSGSDIDLAGPERGVMRALVVVPPPRVIDPPPQAVPDECRLCLVFLISACCSPAALIGLSSLIGSTVLSTEVPVDPSEVLDVVNEPVGHVSGNVAVANSFGLLEVALKFVGLA